MFWLLNVAREPSPYGIVPLQPTEIRAACDLYGVNTPDEREDMFRILTWVDVDYRKMLTDKRHLELEVEKEKAAEDKASGGRTPRYRDPKPAGG